MPLHQAELTMISEAFELHHQLAFIQGRPEI